MSSALNIDSPHYSESKYELKTTDKLLSQSSPERYIHIPGTDRWTIHIRPRKHAEDFNESPSLSPYCQWHGLSGWAASCTKGCSVRLNGFILRGQHDIMAAVIGWQRLKGCTVTWGHEYCLEPAGPENETNSLPFSAILCEWRAKSILIIPTVSMLSEPGLNTSAMSKSE